MREIDDFFDQLNPDIDVIWGTSTDDSLGEDAKVTILATGIEDDFTPIEGQRKDDSYYEEMIPKLYKPNKSHPVDKETDNITLEPKEVTIPLEESSTIYDHHDEPKGKNPKPIIQKWKEWLRTNLSEDE